MSAAENKKTPTVKELFKRYDLFSKAMLDAWVLVDQTGRVVKNNQLFTQLVGMKSKQILKAKSLDELLQLAIGDSPLGVATLLEKQSPDRIDEVRGSSAADSDLNLIIGTFPVIDEATNFHAGTFILLRDVTAEKNLHDVYKTTKTDSITDQLTGLYTRRYFEDYLQLQERNIAKEDTDFELCLIMVDIDFFKKVNDVYGHQAGDHVLKVMGEVMGRSFRKTDVPCRYGGEEFLVILPHTDLNGACLAAENLRVAVEKEHIVFEGTHIPITISCGVARVDFQNEKFDKTMQRADSALYQAKEKGRNQVHRHDGNKESRFKP